MASPPILPVPPPLSELDRPALFLDFDGTLVDIAPTPSAIEVPEGLGRRIAALAERNHGRLALISGRSLDDVERHIGAMGWCRAGSHGLDCRRADGTRIHRQTSALPPGVADALDDFARAEGIDYEAKPHGGALHFRARPEAAGRATRFAEELAAQHRLDVKAGKRVVELVEPGADKGSAVRAFMGEAEFAGALPIFVGDDQTDEDGMVAATALGGFGVIVGERADTVARYRLDTVPEVHEWLGL
jgi:trehalose 6-phosphate phosphatase